MITVRGPRRRARSRRARRRRSPWASSRRRRRGPRSKRRSRAGTPYFSPIQFVASAVASAEAELTKRFWPIRIVASRRGVWDLRARMSVPFGPRSRACAAGRCARARRGPSRRRRRTPKARATAEAARGRGRIARPWGSFREGASLQRRPASRASAHAAASARPGSAADARGALEGRPQRRRRGTTGGGGRVSLQPAPARAVEGGLSEAAPPCARPDARATPRASAARRRRDGRRVPRLRVPRAGLLADVAAEDAIAERFLDAIGQGPAVLDRPVGEAARGVEQAGRDEGLRSGTPRGSARRRRTVRRSARREADRGRSRSPRAAGTSRAPGR